MLSNKRHFTYNLLSSYGQTIISFIVSFLSVPIALNYWGTELYGVWTIITSFATYINASGLGIDAATGSLMLKNNDVDVKIGILKKGVKLLVICSILGSIILVLLSIVYPEWFKIIGKMDEANYPVAKIAAIIFFVGLIINLPFSAVSNSLGSLGKAYIGSIIGTFQNITQFLIVVITVWLKLSLPFYVGLLSFNTIFYNIVKLFIVLFSVKQIKLSENRIIQDNNEDNNYKTILKMGINMSLYGLALLLVPNISNLVISNSIDVKSLVPYSLSYKLFALITGLVANANAAAAPLMGREYGKDNWEWIKKTYHRMFEITVSLSVFVILGVIWLSKPFIRIWTGSVENYSGNLISIILGVYFFGMTMHNINLTLINTFNYTKNVWIVSWADGVIFLISSILLVKKIGVVSVPFGLMLGAYCVSIWAYPYIIYKRSGKRLSYDFKYLINNLVLFVISICVYLFIYKLNLSFILTTVFDFIGLIMSYIILLILIPKDLKSMLFAKIKK